MIESYIEKGIYLHNAIEAAGHSLTEVDGIWFSSDDVIVQDIIDTFDPLPDAQSSARLRVKQHAAGLVSDIYPHIDPNATDVVSFYNYTVDMWQGGALPTRLQSLKDIRDIAVAKIAEINALTDWQLADSYDATIGW